VKKGDWIELRDAPNTRGIVRARFTSRGKIAVHLSGDPVYTLIDLAVLHEHWESMQFEGKPIPYWCRPKSRFKRRHHAAEVLKAEVEEVKPGWVSWRHVARNGRRGSFFMTPWWEFRETWDPVKPPSAWEHLLHGDDDA